MLEVCNVERQDTYEACPLAKRTVIRDLNVELLLQAHDELDGIEGVGAEVVHETGAVLERAVGVELALDEGADLVLDLSEEGRGAGRGDRGGHEGRGAGHEGGEDEGLGLFLFHHHTFLQMIHLWVKREDRNGVSEQW